MSKTSTLSNLSSDTDELWLFERIVRQLQKEYGHSEFVALNLLSNYHKKFTDPNFCDRYNMLAENAEFFLREESLSMADRIHYYEALKNEPNEDKFIQWQRVKRIPTQR